MQAVALDFFEQLIHAALLGFALLLLALQLALGAASPPALPECLAGPAPSRRRLIALQARVTLGEIISQERIFPAALQDDPLYAAGDEDHDRQTKGQEFIGQNREDSEGQRGHKSRV